jgi:hypothetical protein
MATLQTPLSEKYVGIAVVADGDGDGDGDGGDVRFALQNAALDLPLPRPVYFLILPFIDICL